MGLIGALVVGVIGVGVGEYMRRRLNLLRYRLGPTEPEDLSAEFPPEEEIDETALPTPGRRIWIPIMVGLGWAVSTWVFGSELAVVAGLIGWLGLCAIGAYLAAVDLDVHRLPDHAQLALGILLVIAGVLLAWGEPARLLLGLGTGIGCASAFFIIHLISRGSLGFGDVKLALTCGWWLGLVCGTAVFVGMILACVLGIAYSIVTRSRQFAFGPWLIAGTLLAGWTLA